MTGVVKITHGLLLCYAHDLGARNPSPTLIIENESGLTHDHIKKINALHLRCYQSRVFLTAHRPQHQRVAFCLALMQPRNRPAVWLAAYVQRSVYINSNDARWW